MHMIANQDKRAKIHEFMTTRVVYHGLFWLLFLIALMWTEDMGKGFLFTLSNELINVFFYATIVYFNLNYLIPNYLTDNSILRYIGLLILFIAIITPLKVLIFYFKFNNMPEAQMTLLNLQNWYFVANFFIAGCSTLFRISTDWVRHQQDRSQLETQTMQSELKFLKSQINPHFLFNTLNSLYALTLKKSDKAPEIVIKLSEMMRYMLYECNEKRVMLSKEVNYIKNYLDLEKLRHGRNMDIHFEVNGHVSHQKIAPLMFIPFLENSFKHGISNRIEKGFVNIKMNVNEQHVHFNIENSKAEALPSQPNKPSGGIGLVNVRRRLDIIYPNHHLLKISENPNTYIVDLEVELD